MSDSSLNPLLLIGVGSSFAFSSLFYHLYQEKKKELEKLKEIPVFKPDQHLVKVLNASAYKRLHYVAVEGLVRADGEPLTSRFVPGCFGVIQNIGQEEKWKRWNFTTKAWESQSINKKETKSYVPFSLVSPESYISDVCVKVHNPLEASGCFLERVHSNVKRVEEGMMDMILQGLGGLKPVSTKETEELLCVGKTLTAFGEVVMEGKQVMRLQAPRNGRKYILVPTDHKSFMDRHEASASMWKLLTVATGITGASLLTSVLFTLFNKQDDRSK
ncbi:mitochondrial ubiquitin ligase activator of nfkb 1-A [Xenentodon cancila]